MTPPPDDPRSHIAWSTPDRVTVRGLDLSREVLGHMDIGEFSFLQLTGRRPSAAESTMYTAMVITLVEHGMTPSVIAARMTYTGAPESLQAAVAAGISGLGSVFVGSMEGVARDLSSALPDPADASADLSTLARELVAVHRRSGRPVPGLGHPLHTPQDPRAVRLFELARETGLSGRYVELLELVAAEARRSTGRELPINATGAIGALCCELGFPWEIVRGLGVMARAIGLVGHLNEERVRPLAPTLWRYAEGYSGPPGDESRTPGAC